MVEIKEGKNKKVRFSAYDSGPSGTRGHGILKVGTPSTIVTNIGTSGGTSAIRRAEILNLETETSPLPVRKPVFSPTVAVTKAPTYSSIRTSTTSSVPSMDYYTHRTTYSPLHVDSDYVTSTSRARASHVASNVLDDNDLISRRSRLNDARALDTISHTMGVLNAPIIRSVPKPVNIHARGHGRRPPTHHGVPHHVPAHRLNLHGVHVPSNYIYPLHVQRNPVIHEEPQIYQRRFERIEPIDLPRAAESLNSLKRHVVDIQAGMGSQRMLLDRYLPIEMGPTPSVDQGINKKYYELAVRMPNLEPETYRKRSYLQDECAVRLVSPRAMRSQSVEPALISWSAHKEAYGPRQVGSAVAPMSDTRKNIRKLISRTRRDPGFYL